MSFLDDRSVRLAAFRNASLAEKFEVPLSTQEAFQASREFLHAFFKMTKQGLLAEIVAETKLSRKTGAPLNPAMIDKWMEAVEQVLDDKAIELYLKF